MIRASDHDPEALLDRRALRNFCRRAGVLDPTSSDASVLREKGSLLGENAICFAALGGTCTAYEYLYSSANYNRGRCALHFKVLPDQ